MHPVELPTFEGTWWPLQMETITGSGELITVAVLVRTESGQSQVRQSVQPAAFTGMFGADTGKGVNSMVIKTVVEIQRQLDLGIKFAELDLPFGGFSFGNARDCVARDINDIFDVGVRLSAAFGLSAFGRRVDLPDSSRRAFDDWADRVKTQLILQESKILVDGDEFDVRIKLAKKQVRFGILRAGYAANFGVLRPGHTSGDSRSLKAKVFDLEALRRDQILPVDFADAIVGCPPSDQMSYYSRRELETFHASLDFIESEAKARKVNFIRCGNANEAAEHIRMRLRA